MSIIYDKRFYVENCKVERVNHRKFTLSILKAREHVLE